MADATSHPLEGVKVGDEIFLLPTGNNVRYYEGQKLPMLAKITAIKRTYIYATRLKIDRDELRFRKDDGKCAGDDVNAGWLAFRTHDDAVNELKRQDMLVAIHHSTSAPSFNNLPYDAVKTIYDALEKNDAISVPPWVKAKYL